MTNNSPASVDEASLTAEKYCSVYQRSNELRASFGYGEGRTRYEEMRSTDQWNIVDLLSRDNVSKLIIKMPMFTDGRDREGWDGKRRVYTYH